MPGSEEGIALWTVLRPGGPYLSARPPLPARARVAGRVTSGRPRRPGGRRQPVIRWVRTIARASASAVGGVAGRNVGGGPGGRAGGGGSGPDRGQRAGRE